MALVDLLLQPRHKKQKLMLAKISNCMKNHDRRPNLHIQRFPITKTELWAKKWTTETLFHARKWETTASKNLKVLYGKYGTNFVHQQNGRKSN